jgi:hypothetical protein
MSYDSQDDLYCNDGNCCELCGNCEQELVKLNDGDYIKKWCTDCLNDDDTIVIALEAAIGQDGICHKCGLDTSNKPFSKDRPFVVGGKVLHWECLEDIIREVKLPGIIDLPDLQEDSENELKDEEEILEQYIPEYPCIGTRLNSLKGILVPRVTRNLIPPSENSKCCEHAEIIPCVCLYSYKCKVHTNNLQVCHGSHS